MTIEEMHAEIKSWDLWKCEDTFMYAADRLVTYGMPPEEAVELLSNLKSGMSSEYGD